MVLFEAVDGIDRGRLSQQQVLHIRDDLAFLVGEVLLEFGLVVAEELPDNLLLCQGTRRDQVLDAGGDKHQRVVHVVVMALVQIAEDVFYPPVAQHFLGGDEILAGIDSADKQECGRIQTVLVAHLADGHLAEGAVHAQTRKNGKQVVVRLHQRRHLGFRCNWSHNMQIYKKDGKQSLL